MSLLNLLIETAQLKGKSLNLFSTFILVVLIEFLQSSDFSKHIGSLGFDTFDFVLGLLYLLFELVYLLLLVGRLRLKTVGFKVFIVQLLLGPSLFFVQLLVLLLFLGESELVFFQLAFGLGGLVLNLFDPLFMGLLGSRFLFSELAEAFFHRCDLVVHALVVTVLSSEVVELCFDVGK